MYEVFRFSESLSFQDIPEKTKILLKSSLIDILGIICAASENDTSRNIRKFAIDYYSASDVSTRLLFDGRSVSPLGAAWAGGFSADSLDAHEGHFLSKGHAGATVVPALLSLVDAYCDQGRDISGEEFLTLLAIGYEVSLRAGVALMSNASDYHASGAFSGLGVVAAGARILKIEQGACLHAMGIAEYFSPRCPMMKLIDYPSNLRDAHGAGAFSGVNALFLAQSGITGAPTELMLNVGQSNAWQDLGAVWEIDNQYFKPWPVCRWAQPALTAVVAMLELDETIRPENIESVQIETFHESMRLQGYHPKNSDEAQYALAFPVAALICNGELGPNQVDENAIHDEAVLKLADRIRIVESDELSQRFPAEILSRVEIVLKNGRVIRSPISQAKGDPNVPMTKEDIVAKFQNYTRDVLSIEQQFSIIDEIESLEKKSNILQLLSMLTNLPNG